MTGSFNWRLGLHRKPFLSILMLFSALLLLITVLFPFAAFAQTVTPLPAAHSIAVGDSTTCTIMSNGGVKCWGLNGFGQLGDGSSDAQTPNTRLTSSDVLGINNAIALSGNYEHTCALLSDQTLKCWGLNSSGQLGNGATANLNGTPISVPGLSNVTAVGTGYNFTCASLSDGTVKCWGANASGQLGDGTTTAKLTPNSVPGITTATSVSVGYNYACALLSDGTAKCWGDNTNGQLGDNSLTQRNSPVSVSGLTNATALSAESAHTCALINNGTAQCWGQNNRSQLGDGGASGLTSKVPVAATVFGNTITAIETGYGKTCAVVSGQLKCIGYDANTLGDGTTASTQGTSNVATVTGMGSNVVGVALHKNNNSLHACAVNSAGDMECWGVNSSGQLGNGSTVLSKTPVAPIGLVYTEGTGAGLTQAPNILAVNNPTDFGSIASGGSASQTVNVSNQSSGTGSDSAAAFGTALTVGDTTSCALTSTGSVKCWGLNNRGQLGDGVTEAGDSRAVYSYVLGINNATALSGNYEHTCALLSDQTLKCWGLNSSGQLGNGTTNLLNGTPITVPGLSNVTAVGTGYDFTCASLSDGTVKCWGANANGQLGDGTTTAKLTPTSITGITTATGLAVGYHYACALLSDGTAKCWGDNTNGQLGDNSLTQRNSPVSVSGLTNATALSAESAHTCALLKDGTAKCWGQNNRSQLGDGGASGLTSKVPVTATVFGNTITAIETGYGYTCAVVSGQLKCIGYDTNTLGDGATASTQGTSNVVTVTGMGASVVAVAAHKNNGGLHTCALDSAGVVKCWGVNTTGQLGDGSVTNSKTPVIPIGADGGIGGTVTPLILDATTAFSLTGTNAASYQIASGGTCAAGMTLTSGASCTVNLTFSDTVGGAKTANLAIASNAPSTPALVALTGQVTAAPNALSCGPVYATSYGVSGSSLVLAPQLYQLDGNAATSAGAASTNLGAIAQATDSNLYFFTPPSAAVGKFTGSATSAFATTWPNSATGSGEGGSSDGSVYYVGGNYHLYSMAPATGAVTDVGALVAKPGDTIYNKLVAGDVAADNNGRIYWYASVPDASGNPGQGASYLYRIDKNTLQTTNLGQYGPNAATGAAFDSAGKLITTAGYPASSVYSIDLGTSTSTDLGTATGLTAATPGVFDIASCTFPTLDPAFITSTETAANITTSQTPALLAVAGNVVEYTITASNSGNLASDTTTMADGIPAGTAYVAGSTTLNGMAVADVGGKMPFDPSSTASREIHTAGQAAGVIFPGASNAAVVTFKVKANPAGLPPTIDNQATVNYPKVAGSVTTFTDDKTNLVQVPTNKPPVITSDGGGATAAVSVPELQAAATTVAATDPDVGDVLAYSISGGADFALFSIDPTTGKLAFVSPPDFLNPTDAGKDNTYNVQATASDGKGGNAVQDIAVTVTGLPPVITSNGGGATASVSLPENQASVTTVMATDPSPSAALVYSVSGGADAALFAIDPTSGALVFKAAPDFENPTDAGKDNTYNVQVMVSDGKGGSVVQDLAVSITNVNEPPVITSNGGGATASVSVPELQTAATTVVATDPDAGDAATYSITGGADAAKFAIDAATGKLAFVSAPDSAHPRDANTDNVYLVTVTATDKGGLATAQALAVTVIDTVNIRLHVRGFLQGAYDPASGTMRDDLRALGLLPAGQPFADPVVSLGYAGTESAAPALLAATGSAAPTDWVLVELRDATAPKTRVAARAGLLQRGGGVMDAQFGDTVLALKDVPAGSYYVTLRHRNHLGVMSAAPLALSPTSTTVDFTLPATPVYGTDARLDGGGVSLMWAGDANNSNSLIANGPGNDTNVVLGNVLMAPANLLTNSNYRLGGYYATDLNMDGTTLFSGPNNDVNLLLGNVLLHPANAATAANYIVNGGIPK